MKKVLDIFIQNLARKKSDKSETSNTSCNTNPVLKSQVSSGQPMNIAALLSENSTMREICEDFINYLNSQCQNIDNTISAGECAHNIAQHLGREKSKMVEAIKILSDKAIFLDNQSSIAVSKRSFLPIHPIPFAEFSSFTFQMINSLEFLDLDSAQKYNYEPLSLLMLNEKEYGLFSTIYQAAGCSDELIELTREFLQLDANSKIVLACKDSRNGGFVICPHSQDVSSNKLLLNISTDLPDGISYAEENNAWHYNSKNSDVLSNRGFISQFDIWIDVYRCIIYLKNSLFPIRPLKDMCINTHTNKNINTGLVFSKLDTLHTFSYETVLAALELDNKFINPQYLSIYSGSEFINFDFKIGLSQSEYILINYLNGEYDKKAAVFCLKTNALIETCSTTDYDYQLILKMFNYNLKMLNINGFQQVETVISC